MDNKEYLLQMGTKIRITRKSKKISIRKLSALCKFNFTTLSFIERGHKSVRILTLKSIADALEVDVKDFL
jgi:transcriptional regulator with XRE-family HTH domain